MHFPNILPHIGKRDIFQQTLTILLTVLLSFSCYNGGNKLLDKRQNLRESSIS